MASRIDGRPQHRGNRTASFIGYATFPLLGRSNSIGRCIGRVELAKTSERLALLRSHRCIRDRPARAVDTHQPRPWKCLVLVLRLSLSAIRLSSHSRGLTITSFHRSLRLGDDVTGSHLVAHQTSAPESRFSPTRFTSSSALLASSRREAGTRISTYRP